MRQVFVLLAFLFAISIAAPCLADGSQPFSLGGDKAVKSAIDVTVTRGDKSIAAALVPGLIKGDRVTVRFISWEPSNAGKYRFHANLAMINGSGIHWQFPEGDGLPLFQLGLEPPTIQFVYDGISTPIFLIMVEDATVAKRPDGQMASLRDDVSADPNSFTTMTQSASQASDRRRWIDDFISGLGSGAVDASSSGKKNVTAILSNLGVTDTSSIDSCYKDKSTTAQCLEKLVIKQNSVTFSASTEAGFLGPLLGAHLSPYVAGLAILWGFVNNKKHQHYEFLSASLKFEHPALPDLTQGLQELVVPQTPKFEPPAGAQSDALFFSIGHSINSADRPEIVSSADSTKSLCALDSQVQIPLAFDKASDYIHNAMLMVRNPHNKTVATISISDDTIAPQKIERSLIDRDRSASYDVSMTGAYGFDSLTPKTVRVAFPRSSTWQVSKDSDRLVSGREATITLISDAAPCIKKVSIHNGLFAKTFVPKVLDATHAIVTVDLTNVPSGSLPMTIVQSNEAVKDKATLRVGQDDPDILNPVVYKDDSMIFLHGQRLQEIRSLTLSETSFMYDTQRSTGTNGCFIAGHSASGLTADATASVTMFVNNSSSNSTSTIVQSISVQDTRPVLIAAQTRIESLNPDPTFVLPARTFGSTDTMRLTVSGNADLPSDYKVRIRRTHYGGIAGSKCAALSGEIQGAELGGLLKVSGAAVQAIFRPGDILSDEAFGPFQVQLFDATRNIGSDWLTLNGSFVRLASQLHVSCPTDSTKACELTGTNLKYISGISDNNTGPFIPLITPCSNPRPSSDCFAIKPYPRYWVKLLDTAPLQLPASVITVEK